MAPLSRGLELLGFTVSYALGGAEMARGDFMRDAKGSLDDIVRIERKASTAERALGIVERAAQPRSPLAEHFSRPPAREGRP